VSGERIPPRDLSRTTLAENFDDYQGVTLTDQSKASGTAVATTAGGWLAFKDATLGARGITASVARADAGDAHITVRLDDPVRGRTLGTLTVPGTGDKYRYTDVSAALAAAAGNHDVYLVFDKPLDLFSFRLTR
jgi:beta-glucosidase